MTGISTNDPGYSTDGPAPSGPSNAGLPAESSDATARLRAGRARIRSGPAVSPRENISPKPRVRYPGEA